jgi:MFS transporter, SHS family, lactate transporter
LRPSVGPVARPLLICVIAVALSTADQSLFSYAIPEITREFSISLSTIGQILSASFLVASFTVVLAGLASDEFGRARVFGVLLTGSALLVGAQAFVESTAALAALRVLGFAVGAGIYPITNTIVAEIAPPRLRGVLSGLLQMGYPLGFVIASLVAAPMIESTGWRSIFLPAFAVVLMAPLLAYALPTIHTTRAVSDVKSSSHRRFAARLRTMLAPAYRKRFTVCFSGSFLVSLAIGGTTYLLPTYLVQEHHVDAGRASAIAGTSYAIGAIGYLAAALCGEFVTTRRNTVIAWVWLGAVAFAGTVWLAETRAALTVGLGLSIMFFYGSEAVRAPLIAELFPVEVRATAAATTGALAVTTAWLISPMLIAYLAPRLGWPTTFSLCAVVPLVLGGFAFAQLVNIRSGLSIEETSAPIYAGSTRRK